jgi:hypothetical protein
VSRFNFWIVPAVGVFAGAAVWGPFGFRNDWAGFILGVFGAMPCLIALAILFGLAAIIERGRETRLQALSCALGAVLTACTIVFVWIEGKEIDDPVRYAVWSVTHPQDVGRARRREGVFMHWDSWGMAATGDFDSYLVSGGSRHGSNLATIRDWMQQRHGNDCHVADVRRIDLSIYVVTTYDCEALTNDIDLANG